MRGGGFNNASDAGLFALTLHDPRSNANDRIGFRSALGYSSFAAVYGQEIAIVTKETVSVPCLGADCTLRGGAWQNRSGAGLFDLNLHNARSLATHDVGFRSALTSRQLVKIYGCFTALDKGICSHPDTREKIY